MKEKKLGYSIVLFITVAFILASLGQAGARPFSYTNLAHSTEGFAAKSLQPITYDKVTMKMHAIKFFGEKIKISGSLNAIHYDYLNGESETQYILKTDNGNRYRVYFPENGDVPSGKKLTIEGRVLDGAIVAIRSVIVRNIPVNINDRTDISTIGPQKLIVLLVNFQDYKPESITPEEAWDRVFNENFDRNGDGLVDSINGYFKEVSYGKAWLTGNVSPRWYTIPHDRGTLCGVAELVDEAVAAADDDIDFRDYKRLMIIIPGGCNYGGAALVGPITLQTADGEVTLTANVINGDWNIDDGTGIHELGHNFGLAHANYYECGYAVIGDDCTSEESRDLFDAMGKSSRKGHFNAFHKEKLGWFDSFNMIEISAHSDRTYRIYPIEIHSGLKSLKILTENDFNYSIEYRQPIGYDAINANIYGSGIYAGAMIHTDLSSWTVDTQLLDMTPHGIDFEFVDSINVVLLEGETFEDPVNNIAITTLQVTDKYLKIRVGPIQKRSESNENKKNNGNLFKKTHILARPF